MSATATTEDDVVTSARQLRDRLASAVELKHRTDVNNAALRHQLAVASAHHSDALAAHTARLERTHADAIASCLRAVVDVERQHAELHQALLDAKAKSDADAAVAAVNNNNISNSSPGKDINNASSRTRSTRRKNSTSLVAANSTPTNVNSPPPPIPSLDDAPPPLAPAPLGGTPIAASSPSTPPLPPQLPASPR